MSTRLSVGFLSNYQVSVLETYNVVQLFVLQPYELYASSTA
jgi:hypothetical protein